MADAADPKILVVEDDENYAALLRYYLERHGFSVSTARDGEEAWLRVRERRPDLITLDYMMPRRTGFRFFRDLRSDERLKNIPVILITGITMAGTKERNLFSVSPRLAAPDGYLEKPVDEQVLVATVRALLGARGLQPGIEAGGPAVANSTYG